MAATAEIQPISERRGETVRQIGRVREDGATAVRAREDADGGATAVAVRHRATRLDVLKLGETSVAVDVESRRR